MLGSIQTVTVMAEDLDVIEQVYGDHLKYTRVAREAVSEDLAASWGCPGSAGREVLTMRPPSGKDSFLRFVQGDAVPEFKTLRSYGWASTEIVCENVYELSEKLADSPFEVYQPPAVLGFDFTDAIHAFQVIGPAKELLYFTHIDEPVPGLDLPIAEAYIDKTFVTICGGPDLSALEDFYKDIFGLDHDPRMDGNIRVINKAYERPTGTKTTICTVPLPNQNLVELDQFPDEAIVRPRHEGCLPPGMSIVTFHHDNLDDIKADFITPPQIRHEAPYNGARVGSIIGAAGELIELIETKA